MNKKHVDLTHLSHEEMDIFYKRYLTEKAGDLVKDYNLSPDCSNRLYNLLPKEKTEAYCEFCGDTLYSARVRKSDFNANILLRTAKCASCGHKQNISQELANVIGSDANCNCDSCKEIKQAKKQIEIEKKIETDEKERTYKLSKIIETFTFEPRFIPFSEESEDYNLSDVVMLMALIFSRWNNKEGNSNYGDFIAPIDDSELTVYPTRATSSNHPLVKCISRELVCFDLTLAKLDDFVMNYDGGISFYSNKLYFQPNFIDTSGVSLSIKETYEWLSRKFSDGYWYRNWDSQLLEVWIELGVAECVEYAKLKAEEYNFGFDSETKISEIVRDLLHDHSVSVCFYFISASYLNAAAFFQSNKAIKQITENTLKIRCQEKYFQLRSQVKQRNGIDHMTCLGLPLVKCYLMSCLIPIKMLGFICVLVEVIKIF
jgi:hypothetical protein